MYGVTKGVYILAVRNPDRTELSFGSWPFSLQPKNSSIHINDLCEQEFIAPLLFCRLMGKAGVQVPNRLAWCRCKKNEF